MPELTIKSTQTGEKTKRFDVFLSVEGLGKDGGFDVTKSTDSGNLSITVISYVTLYNMRSYILQLRNSYPYPISVTCPIFYIENETGGCHFSSQDHYSLFGDDCNKSVKFNINIEMLPSPTMFQTSLYEDTDMTDFELCAEGGSVKVHRVAMAVTSPVFKAMLTGDWKEASEGRVEVPDTTKETLEHFKKYMYVRYIEKDISCENLLQLLRLASYYMMPDMEQVCLLKIEEHISGKNIWSLLNAVVQSKNGKILMAILRNMNEAKLSALEKEICKPEEAVTK